MFIREVEQKDSKMEDRRKKVKKLRGTAREIQNPSSQSLKGARFPEGREVTLPVMWALRGHPHQVHMGTRGRP